MDEAKCRPMLRLARGARFVRGSLKRTYSPINIENMYILDFSVHWMNTAMKMNVVNLVSSSLVISRSQVKMNFVTTHLVITRQLYITWMNAERMCTHNFPGAVVRQQSWVVGTRPQYAHIRIPQDIVACIRRRLPDACAGKYDAQNSDGKETNVYNVTWSDVVGVKWPTPPKSCTKCGAKTVRKPY